MAKITQTNKSTFEKFNRFYKNLAFQSEVLGVFEREIPNHLEKKSPVAVLVSDTVIAENYKDLSKTLAWLTAPYKAWLNINQKFNKMSEHQIVYRYILLPFPSLIKNWQQRQHLIDIILIHLHIQLWYGVICGAVFVNPQKTNIAKILPDLNFLAIPSHRTFFETPAFHSEKELGVTISSGNQADSQYTRINQIISKQCTKPLWLWYDEKNFSKGRIKGQRWDTLREFFQILYGPDLLCIGCYKIVSDFALDHIAPISKEYFQTLINFRPLCKNCNSAKKDMVREDPFKIGIILPEELQTRDLDDIYRHSPKWLGKIKTPSSLRDLKKIIPNSF